MQNSDIVVITTAESKPGKENIVQQALCDVVKAACVQSGASSIAFFAPRRTLP